MDCRFKAGWIMGWCGLIFLPALVLVACRHTDEISTPKAENAASRKIIGEAVPLTPLEGIDLARMKGSMAYRRAVAWDMLAKLLKPVPVAVPSGEIPASEQTIPLWRTWYEKGEILNMFDTAYYELSDEQAKKRGPICESQIAGIFKKFVGRDIADYGFSTEDFQKKLAQFNGVDDIAGVPGTGFTMFSPPIAAHFLRNYKEAIECVPHARDEVPPSDSSRSYCMLSEFPSGLNRASIYASSRDYSQCQGPQDQFDDRDLGTSVAVKASWFPIRADSKIAVFDTSAAGMKKILTAGEFIPTDTKNANYAIFKDIYSISTRPNINSEKKVAVGMAAAHFTIKQFPDWMWITLWWSPEPNTDFGEDRPDSIPGIWRNYKMCVVVDYQDSKSSMDEEFRRKFPLLTASLDETFDNPNTNTANSWCSNPFIERQKFNARTNCIGCHQHAGSGINPDSIFRGSEASFPHSGRAQMRSNFMSDYLFSFDQNPDQFQHEIRELVRSREAKLPR